MASQGMMRSHALVGWIATLHEGINTVDDLRDATALFDVMRDISEAHFQEKDVVRDVADNPFIEKKNITSNWNNLVWSLTTYYKDVLGQETELSSMIDVPTIASNGEGVEEQILTVVEYVLGCAVQCDQKGQYIEEIMSMDQEQQVELMHIIEGIVNTGIPQSPRIRVNSESPAPDPGRFRLDSEASEGLATLMKEKATLEESLDGANRELKSLRAQFQALREEKEELAQQLEENLSDTAKRGTAEQRFADEVDKIKRAKDLEIGDLQSQLEDRDSKLAQMEKKLGSSAKYEAENRRLQDEVHIAQQKIQQLEKSEAQLEKYKAKLGDMTDLKKQMKSLEEQNEKYLKQYLEMEDENKKIPQLKGQVEQFRSQASTLEAKVSELEIDIQNKDYQISKHDENVELLIQEKDLLGNQVATLKSRIEDMQMEQDSIHAESLDSGEAEGSGLDNVVTPDVRERLLRLERENEVLKKSGSGGGSDEQVALLQSQLDDMSKKKANFEMNFSKANRRNLELEDKVKKLEADKLLREQEASLVMEKAGSSAGLQSKLDAMTKEKEELQHQLDVRVESLKQAQEELITLKGQHELLSKDKVQIMEQLKAEHQKEVESATKELNQELDGLKEQLESAKNNLREMELAHSQATDDVKELKSQCEMKTEEINSLLKEKDSLQSKYIEAKEQAIDSERLAAQTASQNNQSSNPSEEAQLTERLREAEQNNLQLQLKLSEWEKSELKWSSHNQELKTKLKDHVLQEQSLKRENSRLENYLKQAKALIHDLQQKAQSAAPKGEDVARVFEEKEKKLREQIEDKDRELQYLRKAQLESKKAMKREEKLLVSSFYEIGLEIQRLKPMPRVPQAGSFLGRRRAELKNQ